MLTSLTNFHTNNLSYSHTRLYRPSKARRISRACDECRKRKTKCIVIGQHCQTCTMKNIGCTFHFPSCKRGPKPKSKVITNTTHPTTTTTTSSFSSPELNYQPLPHLTDSYFELSSYESNPHSSPIQSSISNSHHLNLNFHQLPYLTPYHLALLQTYFQNYHPNLPIIDPDYLYLGLSQPTLTPSFHSLLQCLLTIVVQSSSTNSTTLAPLPFSSPLLDTTTVVDDPYQSLNANLISELIHHFQKL